MNPLISAAELNDVLNDVAICDIRWDLTDPTRSRDRYRAGHIPGAVFVDLDRDLAGPPGVSGRHPLPAIEDFATTLGRLGIRPDSDVVVYDDVAGRYAARMWWMLRSIGHRLIRVLDGGLDAWEGAREIGDAERSPVHYPAPDGFTGVVTHQELEVRTVIDARDGPRYRGEIEPVDPKAGHIPGAINVPTGENLEPNRKFRNATVLAGIYTRFDDPVVSCGSGVTACHAALAMAAAGLELPDVYVGSFSEWSRHDLPVEVGPNP